MLYLGIVLSFVTLICFIYMLLLSFKKNRLIMTDRMADVQNVDQPWLNQESSKETLGASALKAIGQMLTRRTAHHKRKRQQKLLDQAGLLERQTYEQFMARKGMTYMMVGLITGGLTLVFSQEIDTVLMVVAAVMALVMVAYRFYIAKKISHRKVEIIHALPYTLDLITVSVEAGLSLDGAIARIVMSVSGPLSYEFNQTLKEMRMGIEKKDALRHMADRVEDKNLSMLLSSMIQAEELGVSLSKILRIEGAQLREKRQEAAKEKAMKAPIKMLFPLMFFIFPTIFVIILAPAFIQMSDLF